MGDKLGHPGEDNRTVVVAEVVAVEVALHRVEVVAAARKDWNARGSDIVDKMDASRNMVAVECWVAADHLLVHLAVVVAGRRKKEVAVREDLVEVVLVAFVVAVVDLASGLAAVDLQVEAGNFQDNRGIADQVGWDWDDHSIRQVLLVVPAGSFAAVEAAGSALEFLGPVATKSLK